MSTCLPSFGVHQNCRIDPKHVIALLNKKTPPGLLKIVTQRNTIRTVVICAREAAVDFGQHRGNVGFIDHIGHSGNQTVLSKGQVEVFDGDQGSVVRSGNTAVFTPDAGYFGDAGFHYRVTDANGATVVMDYKAPP